MGRGQQRGKMMTESYPDPLVGLSEVSTPPCTNEECASLRQSTAILSRMFADLSSQAEICQQTKLERDTFRNLVEEKETYIAVLTNDKRQLEHEINTLKLDKQRIESKHGDLQESISSLQQRADLAETCEARANQFEQKLEEQSVELRTANEKRRLVAEKYKETVLLAKTQMEAAERDAKKVIKLQEQVKSLQGQITILRAKPHPGPHLLKFAEDCCEVLMANGLMTPKLSARLKRFRSGSMTSTSIGSDDQDDDELAAHLELLVADDGEPSERPQQIVKEPSQKKAKTAGGRPKSTKVPSAELVALAHANERKRRYEPVVPQEAVHEAEEDDPVERIEDKVLYKCTCGSVDRFFSALLLDELDGRISPVLLERFDSEMVIDAMVDAASTEEPTIESPTTSAAPTETTVAIKKAEYPPTTVAASSEASASTTRVEEPTTAPAASAAVVAATRTGRSTSVSAKMEEPTTSAASSNMAITVKKTEESTTSTSATNVTAPAKRTKTSTIPPAPSEAALATKKAEESTTAVNVAAKRPGRSTTAAAKKTERRVSAGASIDVDGATEQAEVLTISAPSISVTSAAKKTERRTAGSAKKVAEPMGLSAKKTTEPIVFSSKKATDPTTAATSSEPTLATKNVDETTAASAKKTEAPTIPTPSIDVTDAAKKAEVAARAAATRMSMRQRAHRLQLSDDLQLVPLGPRINRPQVAALTKHKPSAFAPPPKLRQQQAKMEYQSEVLLTGVLDKAVSGGPVEAVVHDVTTRLSKVTTPELAAAICKYVGQLDSGDLWPGLVNLPASQRINYPYLSVKEKHLFTFIDQLTCEQQWRDLIWQLGQALLVDTVRRKDPTPAQFGRDVRCSAMCIFLARDNPQAAVVFRALLENVVSRTSTDLAVPAVCFLAVVWPFRFGPLFGEDDSLLFRRLFVLHLAVSTPRNKRTAQNILDRVCDQKTAALLPAEPGDSASEWLLPLIANLRAVSDALVVERDSTVVTVRQSKQAADLERAILSLWTLGTSVKHLTPERKASVLGHLLMEDQHWCELLLETSAVGSVVQRSTLLMLSGRMAAVAGGQLLLSELSRLLESAINARRRLLTVDAADRVDSDEIALFGLNEFVRVVGGMTRSLE